ncbi:OsmC family protein [Falsarthrobacter nasiphocae]|uniref:Organic hydroperoxide reductase OsmC/OhrA n=1 Tax=Falsarthrobacter nasiphocae TaxID=189863 RepID=A0AAE3YIR4_9MICC|nr:OsmC family protein [Falsarthrobacter nasiphocae]MDR6892909.1 organic hydroperoxide reductase OsmC/OhrA [Falsarthrobacter nasiphocae]
MDLTAHSYRVRTEWSSEAGTSGYRAYSRDHVASAEGPGALAVSADTPFRGSADRWNPELMLLSALSSCHMLAFLHEAVKEGVTVTAYEDTAEGILRLNPDHSGQFESATLRPRVTTAEPVRAETLQALHERAHAACFIARSVNFPVTTDISQEA